MCEYVHEDEKGVLNRFLTVAGVPDNVAAKFYTLANTRKCLSIDELDWLSTLDLPCKIQLLIDRVRERTLHDILEPF